jgi:Subtilase family
VGLRTAAVIIAFGCAVLAAPAPAQVGLPAVRLPQLPQLSTPLTTVGQSAANDVNGTPADVRMLLRRATAQRLIRANHEQLEGDPHGEPMVRAQLVGLDLSDAALGHVTAAGFGLLARETLPGLGSELFVLHAPPDLSTHRALQRLHELEPQVSFDYDHVYLPSALSAAEPAGAAEPSSAAEPVDVAPSAGVGTRLARVGLIDAGVQRSHEVFQSGALTLWGCDGASVPSAHGTQVASLLVGHSPSFRGAAPDAALYAADVYCGAPTGGSIAAIAAAFGWLSSRRIAVINVSLVGPDNMILRQIVQRMVAGGHVIVAAVGNDGPAAPPLYPSAYPGVVGVTGVDARQRVLLEAERGPQVSFAAPGADMAAATLPQGYEAVRGTSFAAPLVAGLLALSLAEPDPGQAQRAVLALSAKAVDLGAAGRDNTYGMGLVANDLRTEPALVNARPVAP